MKKVPLLLSIIGLVILNFVLGLGIDNYFKAYLFNEKMYFWGNCIGCIIAFLFAIASFILSIFLVTKSEGEKRNKKIAVASFFAAAILFCFANFSYFVLLQIFAFLLFILGAFKFWNNKNGKIGQAIIILSIGLSIFVIGESLSEIEAQIVNFDVYENLSDSNCVFLDLSNSNDVRDELKAYKCDVSSAQESWWLFQDINEVCDKVVKKYNKEFKTNFSKSDIINKYCKTSEKVKIATKKEAYSLMPVKIREYMAFSDDSKEYYVVNFEESFLDLVKKYDENSVNLFDMKNKCIENIIVDKNGNLFINPSSFLYKEAD